jgi:hypothetical protein
MYCMQYCLRYFSGTEIRKILYPQKMDIYLRFLYSTCKLVFICTYSILQILDTGKYFHFIFFFQIDIRPCYFDERCKGNQYSFGPKKWFFSLCKMSFKQNDSISPAAAGK